MYNLLNRSTVLTENLTYALTNNPWLTPTAILQASSTAMELNHRIRGTYAGVTFGDVKVVRADANAYCIEAAGYFVAGPNGQPQPGRC